MIFWEGDHRFTLKSVKGLIRKEFSFLEEENLFLWINQRELFPSKVCVDCKTVSSSFATTHVKTLKLTLITMPHFSFLKPLGRGLEVSFICLSSYTL